MLDRLAGIKTAAALELTIASTSIVSGKAHDVYARFTSRRSHSQALRPSLALLYRGPLVVQWHACKSQQVERIDGPMSSA